MDPKEYRSSEEAPPDTRTGIDRRSYLGLGLAALTIGGAQRLSKWVGNPAAQADRSYRRRMRWRNTLPSEDWDPANHLLLHHEPFETDSAGSRRWQRDTIMGSSHEVTTGDGQLRAQSDSTRRAIEAFQIPVDIVAPWVAIAATVSARADSAHVAVGVVKDDENVILGGVGPEGPELGYRLDGRAVTVPGSGEVPQESFELLAVFLGDRLVHLTREPGGEWAYRGHVGWRSRDGGVDLYDREEWARWNPVLWVETGEADHVIVDDVRVCHTLQFGVRDPTVVTYPDGTPLVRDGELYLTVTCGSIDHRGYQAVLGLDVESYEVTMRAALWAESVSGYISNYVASHLMYVPEHDEFRQCWSGFGNGSQEPFWNQKCWVSRSTENLLAGTHVVPCELMHLPGGWTGRQHDPFVIRDEEAGTWRCIHTSEAIHRVTVSETVDDQWTGGWTPIASYRDLVHQIEGGKLARIDGEIVLSYADEGSRNHMVTAAYPDPSSGRRWVDVDIPPGDVAPHPSLVAVQSETGMKHLLVTMDGETVYGLGEPSHGALVIYEADGGTSR